MKNFTIPEGYILSEITDDGRIIFRKKDNTYRSKTWEEFCKRNTVSMEEAYIDSRSSIKLSIADSNASRDAEICRNLIPLRYANPMRALMQLLTIREKEYIPEGWNPNGKSEMEKSRFHISPFYGDYGSGVFETPEGWETSGPLIFPTRELAQEFYDTWEDLIEIAKPLL